MAMVEELNDIEYCKQSISDFLEGKQEEWDWDDFITVPMKNPYANSIRLICLMLSEYFPREKDSDDYCNENGQNILKLLRDNFFKGLA